MRSFLLLRHKHLDMLGLVLRGKASKASPCTKNRRPATRPNRQTSVPPDFPRIRESLVQPVLTASAPATAHDFLDPAVDSSRFQDILGSVSDPRNPVHKPPCTAFRTSEVFNSLAGWVWPSVSPFSCAQIENSSRKLGAITRHESTSRRSNRSYDSWILSVYCCFYGSRFQK